MNRYENLIAKRDAAIAAARAVLDGAEKENRTELTADELTAYDGHKADIARLDAAVAREEELAKAESQPRSAPPGPSPSISVDTPEIFKDPKRGFKNFGEQCYHVFQAAHAPGMMDKRLSYLAAAAGMQQAVGDEGGFAVAPAFSNTLYEGVMQASDSLLARCDVYTVVGESLTFLANAETSRATGSRWGGIRGYWIAEADAVTTSIPKLRRVTVQPQQIAILAPATEKVIRNSFISIEQYITRAAIDELNFQIGDAIIEGDGNGKPKGVITAPAAVSVAKEAGQNAATITKANIDNMYARRVGKRTGSYVWYINQDCEPELENLSANVGTGGVPVYLPPGGYTDAPNARLKGRPVVPLEYCSTLGTVGDIILADLSSYLVGVQGTVESAMSMHYYFNTAQAAFRFIFAVDGQPWVASAITPFKGTKTQSPIITLATRS